ncbi:hypothetical protein LDENG_00291320 [Lucifuga dentata]|nr:hypothetical protein LDENG_00291320 [Lucifuga dentata]
MAPWVQTWRQPFFPARRPSYTVWMRQESCCIAMATPRVLRTRVGCRVFRACWLF